MKLSKAVLCLAASPLTMLAATAQAQNLNATAVDLFARDQNVSVRSRPHPEYEASGMRLGSFFLFPRLDASVEHDSNIYATETDEESDTIFRFSPAVSLNSNWNRHALQVHAKGAFQRFADNSLENTEDYDLGGNLRLDIQRYWQASAEANYGELSEPRVAQNTAFASEEPIQYSLTQFGAGTSRTFNRVRLAANVNWADYDYDDGRTIGSPTVPSTIIEQDTRDRETVDLTLRGDYALSPDTAIFLQLASNQRTYDIGSTATEAARDSDGYEILAGADFQVSNLVTGNAAVGYLKQNFDDARFSDISSLGGKVGLEWYPTQLTTVSGSVVRTVEDSVESGAGGFLSTTFSGQVDHELRRNIIVTGQFAYGQDDFRGIDRNDDRWLGAVSGTYLVNRYVGIGVTFSYLDHSSSGVDRGREFTVQKAMLSLVLQR